MENIYNNERVEIKNTSKSHYKNIIGKHGTVMIIMLHAIGVLIDGMENDLSSYGYFWFSKDELKILKNESENFKMKDYKYVAVIKLIEDYNKKDYYFALYENDFKSFCDEAAENIDKPVLAVVNAKGKDNRILGTIESVIPTEEYNGVNITAEVVGIVSMHNYIARENEKTRLAELAKKKAAIEKELETEINKRKSVEYYEEMAKKYSDNPKLAELVAELKEIGA